MPRFTPTPRTSTTKEEEEEEDAEEEGSADALGSPRSLGRRAAAAAASTSRTPASSLSPAAAAGATTRARPWRAFRSKARRRRGATETRADTATDAVEDAISTAERGGGSRRGVKPARRRRPRDEREADLDVTTPRRDKLVKSRRRGGELKVSDCGRVGPRD
jgi:hypothetical protein